MVYNLVKEKNIYVYTNTLVLINAGNKERLFQQLSRLQFSLFPFYEINDPATSLFISKSTTLSPNFEDLKESVFLRNTKDYLNSSPRIKFFNIGSTLSPYLKTLLEYRVFDLEQGEPALLEELVTKNIFAKNIEDSNHVALYNAAFVIKESTGTAPCEAPDHLMRLYAYNNIMRNAGKKLLDTIPEDDDLVREARAAVIVSPVSSLVVLETQEDYDRFKISESKNSLGNASLKAKGSVPEPHEWLLILIALSVLVYIRLKPGMKTIKS